MPFPVPDPGAGIGRRHRRGRPASIGPILESGAPRATRLRATARPSCPWPVRKSPPEALRTCRKRAFSRARRFSRRKGPESRRFRGLSTWKLRGISTAYPQEIFMLRCFFVALRALGCEPLLTAAIARERRDARPGQGTRNASSTTEWQGTSVSSTRHHSEPRRGDRTGSRDPGRGNGEPSGSSVPHRPAFGPSRRQQVPSGAWCRPRTVFGPDVACRGGLRAGAAQGKGPQGSMSLSRGALRSADVQGGVRVAARPMRGPRLST